MAVVVMEEEEEEEEDGAGGAVANAFVFVFVLTTTLWKLPLLGSRLEMVPPPEGRRPKRRVGEGAVVMRCCVDMAIFDDVRAYSLSCVMLEPPASTAQCSSTTTRATWC